MVKTITDYFYNIDPSVMRALKFKEQVENSAAPLLPNLEGQKRVVSQPEITTVFKQLLPSTTTTTTSPAIKQELPYVKSCEEELDELLTPSSTT